MLRFIPCPPVGEWQCAASKGSSSPSQSTLCLLLKKKKKSHIPPTNIALLFLNVFAILSLIL